MSEKENAEKKRDRFEVNDAQELKEILSAVSSEVPGMLKNIMSAVFSEESGRNMGKAAAAYYNALKEGGMPEQVAVKMTEDYMKTFTSMGDVMKKAVESGKSREDDEEEKEDD